MIKGRGRGREALVMTTATYSAASTPGPGPGHEIANNNVNVPPLAPDPSKTFPAAYLN